MNIKLSGYSFGFLYMAAETGELPGYPEVEIKTCYVIPGEEVHFFTHLIDHEPSELFVMAEYAGARPILVRDGERLRKRFRSLATPEHNTLITFAGGIYKLLAGTIVLTSRRTADKEGPEALSLCFHICDETSRERFPAYIKEVVPSLTVVETYEQPALSPLDHDRTLIPA